MSKILHTLKWIERGVDKAFDSGVSSLCNVFLIILAAIVFVEVILRYCFGISHAESAIYSQLLWIWMVFLIAGKVTKADEHITVCVLPDMLTKLGKVRTKAALDIAVHLSMLVFAVWILLFSGITQTVHIFNTGAAWGIPMPIKYWVVYLSVPIGGVFFMYYETKKLIQSIHIVISSNHRKEQ